MSSYRDFGRTTPTRRPPRPTRICTPDGSCSTISRGSIAVTTRGPTVSPTATTRPLMMAKRRSADTRIVLTIGTGSVNGSGGAGATAWGLSAGGAADLTAGFDGVEDAGGGVEGTRGGVEGGFPAVATDGGTAGEGFAPGCGGVGCAFGCVCGGGVVGCAVATVWGGGAGRGVD